MDEQLKRRLIGATVIVALVVIFVPMLFEERPGDEGEELPALPEAIEERPIELPKSAADVAPPEAAKETEGESGYRVIPLDDPPPKPAAPAPRPEAKAPEGNPEVADEGAEPSAEPPARDAPAEPSRGPAKPALPKKPPEPAAPSKPPAARKGPAEEAVAEPAGPKPKAEGRPAKPAPKAVGRASDPGAAAKESKQAAAELEPPSAWIVQVGSFTGEANARALADKLRKHNVAVFVDSVAGSGGALYRVRVGPELSKSRAEQIQKQIENAVGIKGIILPHR